MHDIAGSWIGIGVGLGGGALVGGSAKMFEFVNCAQPMALRVPCVLSGLQMGAMLYGGAGVTLAGLTGVRSPGQFDGVSTTAYDWTLAMGVDVEDYVKGGTLLAKALNQLKHISDTNALAKFMFNPVGKQFIKKEILGNSLPSNKPALWGFTFGPSLGAGFWHETRTIHTFDNPAAWAKAPIEWRLKTEGHNIWLQARGIPATDGTRINVYGKSFNNLLDGAIRLDSRIAMTKYVPHSWVTVKDSKLVEAPGIFGAGKAPPDGGINLTVRAVNSDRGLLYSNAINDKTLYDFGVAFATKEKVVWESHTSTPIKFVRRDPDDMFSQWKNNFWEMKLRSNKQAWSF